jgi:hypothetical protein
MQVKIKLKYHFTPTRQQQELVKIERNQKLMHSWWVCKMVQALRENSSVISQAIQQSYPAWDDSYMPWPTFFH